MAVALDVVQTKWVPKDNSITIDIGKSETEFSKIQEILFNNNYKWKDSGKKYINITLIYEQSSYSTVNPFEEGIKIICADYPRSGKLMELTVMRTAGIKHYTANQFIHMYEHSTKTKEIDYNNIQNVLR